MSGLGNLAPESLARRPTMADVAQAAGVSTTTVSFIVNNREDVTITEATRQRVLAAVRRLGYRPNRAAQGLRTRRTGTIGFIADERSLEQAGRLVSAAHEVAWAAGSLLIVVNTMRSPEVMQTALDDLLDRQVDMVIVAALGTREVALPAAVSRVPTVLANCFQATGGPPCVLPDEVGGGRAAARLVLTAGHTRIAYLCGSDQAWATRARISGLHSAVQDCGLAPTDVDIRHGAYELDSGYDMTTLVLRRRRRPTAVLYGNDRMALGGYLAIAEAGLRVPQDISVVGYDDQDRAVHQLRPPMSTVRLPYAEMGRWAAEQLLSGSVAGLPPRTYLSCLPVSRASVAPPPP